MIDKLVEVLAKLLTDKFIPDRKELSERRAREQLVFLLEALLQCHAAYESFERDQGSDDKYQAWRSAVENLVNTLQGLRITLSTLWPDAFDAVHEYAASESIPRIPADLRVRAALGLDSLSGEYGLERALHEMDPLRSNREMPMSDSLRAAVEKLREAIKDRLSEGEIFRAQASYSANKR